MGNVRLYVRTFIHMYENTKVGETVEIVKMPIADLNPAVYNPRVELKPGMPEYEKLRRSIETFGLVEPIVWNRRTGNVVGGHQRLSVERDLGRTETFVSIVDLDEREEMVLNVALNKVEGQWDEIKLKDLLQELDTGDIDLELTGFDMDEIEKLMTAYYNPDFQPGGEDEQGDLGEIDPKAPKLVQCPNCHHEFES